MTNRPHIVDGEFQSDKYPTCPRGKVPLSVQDPTAQDLLWEYAQRHRSVDADFADDLEFALTNAGYRPATPRRGDEHEDRRGYDPECDECKALQGDLCSTCYADEVGRLKRENEYLRADLASRNVPVPMRIVCPGCCALHIDEGEFATKLHHTHACQSCGEVWRPAIVPTVGVRFLPGFKNGGGL